MAAVIISFIAGFEVHLNQFDFFNLRTLFVIYLLLMVIETLSGVIYFKERGSIYSYHYKLAVFKS